MADSFRYIADTDTIDTRAERSRFDAFERSARHAGGSRDARMRAPLPEKKLSHATRERAAFDAACERARRERDARQLDAREAYARERSA
jgi:hypothetical protein